jgi:hypothetical protein
VVHDLDGRGAVFWARLQHPRDEIVRFLGVRAETQLLEVGLFLFDVVFADLHPALVVVEGVAPAGEHVEEDAAEGEDVDGALDALSDWVGGAGRVARGAG